MLEHELVANKLQQWQSAKSENTVMCSDLALLISITPCLRGSLKSVIPIDLEEKGEGRGETKIGK